MKNFLKTYKSTLILLAAIIVGTIVGIVFKEKAAILSPLGDIFLNLMLVIIVPLIFLSITTSISKMKKPKRLGKIMSSIVIVFILTSVIAAFVGIISTYSFRLVDGQDSEKIKKSLEYNQEDSIQKDNNEVNILKRTVSAFTVNDFQKLLSKDNLIALIFVSIIVGLAMNMAGDKAKDFEKVLNSANEVVMKMLKIVMYYAPIGLGSYFASLIGAFGSSIAIGYAKTFIIYTIVAILFYLIVYTFYAYVSAGVKGVKSFWKNILPATATAFATCSSAASIPVNIETTKKIGVSDDISETIVPLGTSFHKDGSIIGSVFKVMFLAYLFGTVVTGTAGVIQVIGVSLFATLLVTAVPIGGGTISEMMIITMMGFPVAALPILTVIATIIDPPATVLNVIGDTSSAMITSRLVDGKNWQDKSIEKSA